MRGPGSRTVLSNQDLEHIAWATPARPVRRGAEVGPDDRRRDHPRRPRRTPRRPSSTSSGSGRRRRWPTSAATRRRRATAPVRGGRPGSRPDRRDDPERARRPYPLCPDGGGPRHGRRSRRARAARRHDESRPSDHGYDAIAASQRDVGDAAGARRSSGRRGPRPRRLEGVDAATATGFPGWQAEALGLQGRAVQAKLGDRKVVHLDDRPDQRWQPAGRSPEGPGHGSGIGRRP